MKTQYFTISFILFMSLLLLSSTVRAEDTKTALSINGKPITLSTLQNEYNNRHIIPEETTQDFIDSYVLKRLIIEEALAQKVDTTESYQREFRIYQQQLMDSYMADTVSSKNLLDRISDRFDYELELNHAFAPFDGELVFPKDTIMAFQKSQKQREIAIKEGFSKIEKEIQYNSFGIILDINSETGYLGWIRPLMFSLEIDDIIFSLEIGEVSQPIRSKTGYHIFQVTGKRPARGVPVIEQVMFNFPVIPANKKIQDSVYNVAIKTYDEIAIRGNFQEICDEFATAFNTGERGCLLGKVDLGEKIPYPLIRASYELDSVNSVSPPILSDYGYHILRLKNTLPPPSKQQIRNSLEQNISSSAILPTLRKDEIKRLLSQISVKVDHNAYKQLLSIAENYVPHDSLFLNQVKNLTDIILTVDEKNKYTVEDFMKHIRSSSWIYKQKASEGTMSVVKYEPVVTYTLTTDILDNYLEGFISAKVLQYKKQLIQEENKDYQNILQNLKDGLLYTTLMEKEVWRKTKTDYEGLQKTFLKNKSKYKMDGEYFRGLIVHCKEEKVANEIKKLYKNTITPSNELRSKYNRDGMSIDIDEGLWQQGDNEYVDTQIFKSGNKGAKRNYPYYVVIGKHISTPHDFSDVKAQVELDYQQVLTQEWQRYLKSKYEVIINKNIVNKLK